MSTMPDAAIGSRTEDLLGRAPFVEEVVELITTTPRDWTPRIGIYGNWGTGKTSVLNMIAERLIEEHHVAARFNPWGFDDPKKMFSALADAILDAISSQSKDIRKSARHAEAAAKKAERAGKAITNAAKQASDAGIPGASIAKGIGSLAGFVGGALGQVFAEKKLKALHEALGSLPDQARCAVFIDDLDRADPSLLPKLLFALHEVLNSLPATFVVALDPAVVGMALKEHHPGFGDGLAFLEKMVQFPRWLPDVADAERWRLAERDVRQYLDAVDPNALRQEFARFPRNPRELRTLLRGLWGLNTQACRYHPGEINWNIVLRIAALRHRHRQAIEVMFEDEERLDRIIGASWAETGQQPVERRQGRQPPTPALPPSPILESALRAANLDPSCSSELANAFGQRHLLWSGEVLIRHANLITHPP